MVLASGFYQVLVCLMNTVELKTSGKDASASNRVALGPKARMNAGAVVPRRELATISGQTVSVPDPEGYVHLQFRRFAGCPICDLHLRCFVRRHEEILRAGICEVVVFHAHVTELRVHASDLPFAVVADPHKRLYAEFGVGASVRSLLDPRAWSAIVRGVSLRLWEVLLARKHAPSFHITGGRLGLPADFLIASDGTVIASKYGMHAYDQWSVDDLLSLVTSKKVAMAKSPEELHQELRQRILSLPGVTERQNAGIREDAFFVGRTMFMHIHGQGHCDIRLSKGDQARVLAEGKAWKHRWAPDAGYVTSIVTDAKDLERAMGLIQMSHRHFAADQEAPRTEFHENNGDRKSEQRMLRLFVIGATGRTGHEIVQQALSRGHQVTAFVRSPETMTMKDERLSVRKGDAMSEDQLSEAIQNHDAVLSTLGPREVFQRSSMMQDSARATTRAMKRSGVKRLVVLSAAAHFPGLQNRVASYILRNHMRDSLAMEAIVAGSGLDWTIARPPRLTAQGSSTYRSREGAAPRMAFTLSRKAVAAFMLDAIEREQHLHKIVGLAK
jgi:putative NADH-flavin reductase/peroxiredoxin